MSMSLYNLCLLIIITKGMVGAIRMQTDNTIILSDDKFAELEENKLKKAKLIAKPKEKLTSDTLLLFNSYILSLEGKNIHLRQKGQGKKIQLVDSNLLN